MKNLYKALSEFQAKCPLIKKDASNPFFKSKYAPLENILPIVLPLLRECGLVAVQSPSHVTSFTHISGADSYQVLPSLKTRIVHIDSEEMIEENAPLILDKQNPQGQGSAITYMRRYALVSMLGLNCDEDDDGNKASAPKETKKAYQAKNKQDYENQVDPLETIEDEI